MRTIIVPVILASLIAAGCIGQVNVSPTTSMAAAGDTVSLYYTLKVDGQMVDSNENKQVLTFTIGSGQVIPGFDKGVTGMKVGDEKTFSVSPEDGYGVSGSHPLAGKTLVFTVRLVDIKKG
jgi:FKBP-type peptidyl-prolyl cis-trans isomerase 2